MGNRDYCQFQNTVQDLKDCKNRLTDDLEGVENEARSELIELCEEIVAKAKHHNLPRESGKVPCPHCGTHIEATYSMCEDCFEDREVESGE